MLSLLQAQEPIAQQRDFNVEFLSNRQIQFPEEVNDQYQRYSDIWGYTSENGTEYAILGTGIGTAIYELSDPANPNFSITGARHIIAVAGFQDPMATIFLALLTRVPMAC